ncbi:NAD(P)-dependent oxidoreductase [Ornithinimicrobium sediminis]|uniref:NAD(P)-dependent oxidoreductase n=1 Tax=Ornithinimicrobium sediminis TaxID=2904603 RepID=UPI001E450D44|nr:NAD(P)H-binding protein [Ornithinimicrobium sediminis]MCE0487225.1 NAD(P)H-binding protein [Ornithinimicrobium sediminis]
MRIALLGATGRTGRLVLAAAVHGGHQVSALARTPDTLTDVASEVRVVPGSSTDRDAVHRVLDGADVVISALGPTSGQADLHSRTAAVLLEAMPLHGVPRFVGVSGAGVDVPGDRKGPRDRLVSALIQRLGGEAVRDKPREHQMFAASDLEWTLVRPPRLTDTPPTGLVEHHAHVPGGATSVSRHDLATFVLDVAEQGLYPQLAPFVSRGLPSRPILAGRPWSRWRQP